MKKELAKVKWKGKGKNKATMQTKDQDGTEHSQRCGDQLEGNEKFNGKWQRA